MWAKELMDLSRIETPSRIRVPILGMRDRLWKFHAIGDGSCLLHAILLGFASGYRSKCIQGQELNRVDYVRNMRQKLGLFLYEKDEHGIRVYDRLGNGNLASLGAQGDEALKYTIEYMYAHIVSTSDLEFQMLELISWFVQRNILILSANTRDVYKTGLVVDTYRPEWFSVVLWHTGGGDGGHFDLVGISHENMIVTHFTHEHPLVQSILQRSKQMEKQGK